MAVHLYYGRQHIGVGAATTKIIIDDWDKTIRSMARNGQTRKAIATAIGFSEGQVGWYMKRKHIHQIKQRSLRVSGENNNTGPIGKDGAI